MKKLLAVIFMILLLALPVHAAETPPFDTPYELITYWGETSYPDNVGTTYFDPEINKVAIPLVWGDAQEVLSLLKDPSTVEIVEGDYPYNELKAVADEISSLYMGEEYGITSVSVGYGTNGGFGESGKASRVVVTIKIRNYSITAAFLAERYGGCVAFESEQGVAYSSLEELNTHISIMERDDAVIYILILCIALPVILFTVFFYRLRKKGGK